MAAILVAVFVVARVEAAPAGLPELMVGATTVTIGGQTFSGGMTGNYAVLNNDTNASYGFNTATTNGLWQPGCLDQTFFGVTGLCFVLGTGLNGSILASTDRLMTSRTTVNGVVVYELPALLFSGINVNGDVSGNLSYLKNWGTNNLNENSDNSNTGAAWNLGTSYTFNPAAQVKIGSDEYKNYQAKLATLAGSGTVIDATSLISAPNLYLQSDNITNPGNNEAAKYPEGKVWVVNGGLSLNSVRYFSGVGTIIIRSGSFQLAKNAQLLPDPAVPGSRLGIIVMDQNGPQSWGNCIFPGNNKVKAMVFCASTLSASWIETNLLDEFTGSFVANDFLISPSSSVFFTYDPAFDDNQPPGFRDLISPASKEIGNK